MPPETTRRVRVEESVKNAGASRPQVYLANPTLCDLYTSAYYCYVLALRGMFGGHLLQQQWCKLCRRATTNRPRTSTANVTWAGHCLDLLRSYGPYWQNTFNIVANMLTTYACCTAQSNAKSTCSVSLLTQRSASFNEERCQWSMSSRIMPSVGDHLHTEAAP